MPNKIRTKYRYHRIIFVVLWCAITFCSCSSHINDELHTAYSLCATQPDSALAILQSIKPHMADASPKEKALYDISYEASYYIKHKVPTISADSALAYIDQSYGQELYLMKRILCGIHMFKSKKMEEAFAIFQTCNQDIELDIHPYWKCVIDDYLAIIYLNCDLMERSKEHFYKVMHRAEEMQNAQAIANAYLHLQVYYHANNQLDSALIYASKVLYHEDVLDSNSLVVAHHNIANLQMKINQSANNSVITNLIQSKNHNTETTSFITLAILSQAYYLNGNIDSANYYKIKVIKSNNKNAKSTMYKFLAKYYTKLNMADSAYKYLRLKEELNTYSDSLQRAKNVLNIHHTLKQQQTQEIFSKQKKHIILCAIFSIMGIVAVFLWRHKQQIRKATSKIAAHESQIDELSIQKDNLITILDNQKTLISSTQDSLTQATKKLENYTAAIHKKNAMLAKANRGLEKAEANTKEQSQTIIHNFLDKSVANHEKMNKTQMEYIIEAYRYSRSDRTEFIKTLLRLGPELTPTGVLICILYHEGFTDEDIINKLHYVARNFRMAKSRARTAIETPQNTSNTFIEELLSKFYYKRTS